MKLQRKWQGGVVALLAFCTQSAMASHIDSNLGVGVSLFSNDGAGNFTLQVDEYMSPYTEAWVGAIGGPGAWASLFSSPNLLFSISGAPVTGPTTGALAFQGIVDLTGTTFYNVPATTWAVNVDVNGDTTDAGKYSGFFNYHITGFNSNLSYSLTAKVSDCCADVPPPTLLSKQAQVSFTLAPVPEPGVVWMMGAGLLVLIARARKQRA